MFLGFEGDPVFSSKNIDMTFSWVSDNSLRISFVPSFELSSTRMSSMFSNPIVWFIMELTAFIRQSSAL